MDESPNGNGYEQRIHRRLRELGRTVSPAEIAELWVFPPLVELHGSAEFLLFTRFDGTRRRLYSACLSPGVSANGTSGQRIVEHGRVPPDRVPRLVRQLQRRLGEAVEPVHVEINGCDVRWTDFLTQSHENTA